MRRRADVSHWAHARAGKGSGRMTAWPSDPGHTASLLEVEPRLARLVGAGQARAIGHRLILPVLTVTVGAWSPPAAEDLEPGTVAFAVLEGFLLGVDGAKVVVGPGDRLAPWSEELQWTACTDVRLAMLGRTF